eukprot:1041727-Pyramimonas_sp.AAC.1
MWSPKFPALASPMHRQRRQSIGDASRMHRRRRCGAILRSHRGGLLPEATGRGRGRRSATRGPRSCQRVPLLPGFFQPSARGHWDRPRPQERDDGPQELSCWRVLLLPGSAARGSLPMGPRAGREASEDATG